MTYSGVGANIEEKGGEETQERRWKGERVGEASRTGSKWTPENV